jgi:hypothetical protein
LVPECGKRAELEPLDRGRSARHELSIWLSNTRPSGDSAVSMHCT